MLTIESIIHPALDPFKRHHVYFQQIPKTNLNFYYVNANFTAKFLNIVVKLIKTRKKSCWENYKCKTLTERRKYEWKTKGHEMYTMNT